MRIVLFALVMCVLAGCSGSRYAVDTISDAPDGFKEHKMRANWISSYGDGEVEINLQRRARGTRIIYALSVEMRHLKDAFPIALDSSLTLNVDGERMVFRILVFGRGSGRNLRSYYFSETGYYPATLERIERIAFAHEVQVEIRGERRVRRGHFTEENIARFKRFLKEYCLESSARDRQQ